MTVLDDSRPSGAVAVRLTPEEAAAVLEAVALASCRKRALARAEGERSDEAEEARVLAAAVRKLDSLGDFAGLEVHARAPILNRNPP